MWECTATTHSLQLPAECSRVSRLNAAHWCAPAPCIQNGQALSECLIMRNNKWQSSQATQLWVDVLPRCLAKPHRPTCDQHFILNGRRNEEDWALWFHSSLHGPEHISEYHCRAERTLQVSCYGASFLLSPATKINKKGANGAMGSWESRAHSFLSLRKNVFSKRIPIWRIWRCWVAR